MKIIFNILFVCMIACNSAQQEEKTTDSLAIAEKDVRVKDSIVQPENPVSDPPRQPIYSNQRFRNVTITTLQGGKYAVSGEGQIFEASFNWVIEDGHYELDSGYATTDAGAPEWGKFRFEILPKKRRDNSQLTLILYEASAKDGSRQHLLPIPILK